MLGSIWPKVHRKCFVTNQRCDVSTWNFLSFPNFAKGIFCHRKKLPAPSRKSATKKLTLKMLTGLYDPEIQTALKNRFLDQLSQTSNKKKVWISGIASRVNDPDLANMVPWNRFQRYKGSGTPRFLVFSEFFIKNIDIHCIKPLGTQIRML